MYGVIWHKEKVLLTSKIEVVLVNAVVKLNRLKEYNFLHLKEL